MKRADKFYREMVLSGRSMGRRRRLPRWAEAAACWVARTVFVPGQTLGRSLDAYAQARGLSKSETLRELLTIGLATQVAALAKGGAR